MARGLASSGEAIVEQEMDLFSLARIKTKGALDVVSKAPTPGLVVGFTATPEDRELATLGNPLHCFPLSAAIRHGFALDSGAAVIFPGGTSDVPADGDTFDVFSNHHGLPVAPNGALAAGPGRALPAALGLALSWAFSQIRY